MTTFRNEGDTTDQMADGSNPRPMGLTTGQEVLHTPPDIDSNYSEMTRVNLLHHVSDSGSMEQASGTNQSKNRRQARNQAPNADARLREQMGQEIDETIERSQERLSKIKERQMQAFGSSFRAPKWNNEVQFDIVPNEGI